MDALCFRTLSPHNIQMIFSLSFSFFFIWGITTSYASEDDFHYTNCSLPFECGLTKNITYPFWGKSKPGYCGREGFELGCQGDDEYAFMDFKDQRYRVLGINQADHVMTVARDDLRDRFLNTTMDNNTLFDYPEGVQNLTIFYCPDTVADQSPSLGVIQCSSEPYSNVSVAVIEDEFMEQVLAQHPPLNDCSKIIKVPVLQRAVDELKRESSTDWAAILDRGFELAYTVDYRCSACELSRGICGTNSLYADSFVCYCSDKPYPLNCPAAGKSNVAVKLGIGAGITLFMLITIYLCKKLRPMLFKGRKTDRDIENFIKQHGSITPKIFSYSKVKRMTNSFREKLGEGGFGAVYSGKLPDGTLVAVKLLNASKGNGEEFINEVASISRTSHINIVTLLGFCYQGHRRALIYEFMSKGSLDKVIANENALTSGRVLQWEKLYQISVGIARGLEYLHRGCNTRILHFDIKPQNILLDGELNPKISDFALSNLCLNRESIVSVLMARGTIGYIAPEVFSRNFGVVSHKSDVYSYGMVLLEMVGGRKKDFNAVVDRSSEMYFHDKVYQLIEEEYDQGFYGQLKEEDKQTAKKMAMTGIWCIQADPKQRPSMGKVIEMLEGSVETLPTPPKPFLFSPPRSPIDSLSVSVSTSVTI